MRIVVLIFLLSGSVVFGQRNLRDSSISTFVSALNYKFNLTDGDVGDLWGFNHEIGLSVDYKFKNNLTVGINSGFIFGNQFRDTTIFAGIVNDFGQITSMGGSPAQILFLMRGMTANANVGFVWSKLGNNPNSGLWIQLGGGFLMHKIRIESLYDDVPQLEGEYRKGYDRLHMGFEAREFIGYLFQADRRFLNFYAGFEFIQGFTQNQRLYNFDLGGPDPGIKQDYFYGIKVGWLIPIYKRSAKQYYVD
ncbi:hypothetical protein K6119_07345 [Paracrocinitomix mangrovi]|uniref:hypothetical protein n=1 Tax=Paracrocinitomix mangrovi TaxID=2862509 RepID=UPI001C8DB69E|nr:hypothetical protein [Paracrocinitomix mangrovi]UKN03328.1 hypothetical protein K6119_07345 [Paracrocinitomix mangrovi]